MRKAPLVSEEPDKEKEKALTVAKTEKPVKAGKGSKKEKGTDKSQRQNLLFICNFTPVDRPDYRVGVPEKKTYTQIMDEHARAKV